MKRLLILLCVPVLLACGVSSSPDKYPASSDPTTPVAADDSEMNAAIAKARATLPEFYKHWQKPGPGEEHFCLKLRITDGAKIEHFWLADIKGTPGHLTGVVGNEPEEVHTVKMYETIPIPDADISDWMYYRNGKVVGNLTVRALFKEMSPEDVKKMKSQLADP